LGEIWHFEIGHISFFKRMSSSKIACHSINWHDKWQTRMGRCGRDRMVVGFTTTYAISAYHHWYREFESRSGRGVTTLCDKVCQWLATGRWFSPGPPVFSTNKTDRHDITEILLKVAFNTIKQTNGQTRILVMLPGKRRTDSYSSDVTK
jgi:hypothetical protein